MSWVAAGVAVVGGGIKLYQGYQQKKAGERAEAEAEKNTPEFEIPQEEIANLRDAQKRAMSGLPEAQRRAAEQDIQRTSQAAMRSSATRRGGLGMISQVAAQEGRSNLALMQADVQARRQNIQDMMRQRSVIAGYKQKRFEHEYNEYSADLDYARAQIGAGIQNQQAGIDGILGGVGQGIAGSMVNKQMQMQNQTNNPNTTTNNNQPNQFRLGGGDGNIFTGKRKEAYNQFMQGTGMFAGTDPYMSPDVDPNISFKEFRQSEFNPYGPSFLDKTRSYFGGE